MRAVQADLFAARSALPAGLLYEEEFLSTDEEAALLEEIARLPLEQSRYKEYTARRRVASFGSQYDFGRNELADAPGIPDFLLPLRCRIGSKTGIVPSRFSDALVSEYRAGTPLGWHRDVPDFETVAGVSLGSACRIRFRRYPHTPRTGERAIDLVLQPGSLYVMQGEARWRWQHSIPPTPALRHSITFRTRRVR
jgi:alkylated DNA repair dioxygenase AlkB